MITRKYTYYRDDLLLDNAHEKREKYPNIAILELFGGEESKFVLHRAISICSWPAEHINPTISKISS